MKVCGMCGAQNDDVFTKCSVCGADLPSPNGAVGDDEKTVLIDSNAAQPSGLSLKQDAAQNNGQPAMNGMSQGMPGMNGQPAMNGMPQGMPGMNGQSAMPGMNGAPYGQPGFGGPAAPQQPKAKKGLIFGVLGVAVVVLVVAFVLIFKGGAKGGVNSAEAVARQFIEAMDAQDVDMLAELCPPFLDPGKDELQSMIDMYSGYDVTFTYEGVEDSYDYDSEDLKDLQEEVSDYSEKKIKLDAACDLDFSFNVAVTMLGETYDESSTYSITCIKYKGNWYLYE